MLAGHRWRIAISTNYWPAIWPSPEPVTLSIFTGQSTFLTLPIRTPQPEDFTLADFGEAEWSSPLAIEELRAPSRSRSDRYDRVSRKSEFVFSMDSGRIRFLDNGLEYEESHTDHHQIVSGAPLSASAECKWKIEIARGEWQTCIHASSKLTADTDQFLVTSSVEAYEGQVRVFAKTQTRSVPRDLV
jgi:uncharacterized protein